MAERAQPGERVSVTLTPEELELVREALWVASQAELAAMTEDEALRQALIADLRDLVRRREQGGKPTFRDRFVPLEPTAPIAAGAKNAPRPGRSLGLTLLGAAFFAWALRRWLR